MIVDTHNIIHVAVNHQVREAERACLSLWVFCHTHAKQSMSVLQSLQIRLL